MLFLVIRKLFLKFPLEFIIILLAFLRILISLLNLILVKITYEITKKNRTIINFEIKQEVITKIDFIIKTLMTILMLLVSTHLIYSIIYLVIRLVFSQTNLNKDICSYISLTLVLSIVSYFPKNTGTFIFNILKKFFKKFESRVIIDEEIEDSKNIIALLNPKLWMYLLAAIITIINSMEKIQCTSIFNLHIWSQIKPVITEAVLTFIVIDSFIALLLNKNKINNNRNY